MRTKLFSETRKQVSKRARCQNGLFSSCLRRLYDPRRHAVYPKHAEYQIVDFFLGSKLKDEVMKIMPVQKVSAAGQITRFKAFVAVGDESGHVGLGVKCAKEVSVFRSIEKRYGVERGWVPITYVASYLLALIPSRPDEPIFLASLLLLEKIVF